MHVCQGSKRIHGSQNFGAREKPGLGLFREAGQTSLATRTAERHVGVGVGYRSAEGRGQRCQINTIAVSE